MGSGIPSCERGDDPRQGVAVQVLLECCVSGGSPDNARVVEECDRRAQGGVGGALVSPEAQADALTAQATSTANLSRTFWVGAVAVRRPGSVGSCRRFGARAQRPRCGRARLMKRRGLTTPERRPVDRDRLLWVWDSATPSACPRACFDARPRRRDATLTRSTLGDGGRAGGPRTASAEHVSPPGLPLQRRRRGARVGRVFGWLGGRSEAGVWRAGVASLGWRVWTDAVGGRGGRACGGGTDGGRVVGPCGEGAKGT